MDLFEYAQNQSQEEDQLESNSSIYTVTTLTAQVKGLITSAFGRETFWVKGEISNFKGRNQSGHMYFRLKDENAVLNCVFFRGANRKLQFDLQDGLQVLALGRLDLWERGGNYQLVVEDLRPGGAGELYLRFELLKKKLEAEGLFDPARKRPLPSFPKRIGIITSPTGAVIRDIIHVTQNRCPNVSLVLFPVKVQGDGAAQEIASALEEANLSRHELDLLIVGRGGGSIEDLWAFNEEIVARAISTSRLPVISAVGHQTDFTIADFVADVRAATPSQAAEMAVPNLMDLRRRVDLLMRNIVGELVRAKDLLKERLERLRRSAPLRDPRVLIQHRAQRLDQSIERLAHGMDLRRARERERLERCFTYLRLLLGKRLDPVRSRFEKITSNLGLLNPLAILARGYSVVTQSDGAILKAAQQTKIGEEVSVRLYQGGLECRVTKISKA